MNARTRKAVEDALEAEEKEISRLEDITRELEITREETRRELQEHRYQRYALAESLNKDRIANV